MGRWLAVAKLGDLKTDGGRCVEVKGRLIALFRQGDEVFALDDCCPHAGAPLSEGWVDAGVVTCPWHAWRFRITDGIWADAPKSGSKVRTYPVAVQNEEVFLEVDW